MERTTFKVPTYFPDSLKAVDSPIYSVMIILEARWVAEYPASAQKSAPGVKRAHGTSPSCKGPGLRFSAEGDLRGSKRT